MMGGRVAEEMIFGQRQGDVGRRVRHRAGDQARAHDGDALGPFRRARHRRLWREPGRGVPRPFGGAPAEHLGGDRAEDRYGDPAAGRGGLPEAREILADKRDDLEMLAQGLLEFETLSGDEIKDLLTGKRPMRESVIEPSTPRSSAVPDRRQAAPAAGHRRHGAAAAGLNRRRRFAQSWNAGQVIRPAFSYCATGVPS